MVIFRVNVRGEHRVKTGWEWVFALPGVVLGVVALYVALKHVKVEPTATTKAFTRLEADVEDLFARVESHLGRLSRLKGRASPPAEAVVKDTRSEKPMTRAALYAAARRSNADKNRHGVGEERGK